MTHVPRSLLLVVTLLCFAGAAFAQQEETTTEKVDMQVGMPGMPMPVNMNVNVKTTTTTKKTTTRSSSWDDDAQPRMGNGPAPAPAPSRGGADCGAGEDPGCTMMRNGHSPLDAESFQQFLEAVRSNDNEINRTDIAKTLLKSSYLTAKQLGLLLDLFENEINRMDVAKLAAPHLVNPKHALGLAKKFDNSINATDFSKLILNQR